MQMPQCCKMCPTSSIIFGGEKNPAEARSCDPPFISLHPPIATPPAQGCLKSCPVHPYPQKPNQTAKHVTNTHRLHIVKRPQSLATRGEPKVRRYGRDRERRALPGRGPSDPRSPFSHIAPSPLPSVSLGQGGVRRGMGLGGDNKVTWG